MLCAFNKHFRQFKLIRNPQLILLLIQEHPTMVQVHFFKLYTSILVINWYF